MNEDQPNPSPMSILKQSVSAIPELKYALGIVGVVAAIAVIGGLGVDYRIAVFGTIVMLVLMTALVVFTRSVDYNKPTVATKVFTWFAMFVVMATAGSLFSSVFFRWPVNLQYLIARSEPSMSSSEHEISKLEDAVMILKGAWENIDSSSADRLRVAEEGPKLGRLLLQVSDSDLRLAWRLVKYEYALYAYTMAASAQDASTQSGKDLKVENARKALENGRIGLRLVSRINECQPITEECKAAREFLIREEDEDRLKYLSAISLCRLAEHTDIGLRDDAKRMLEGVSKAHLAKYPVDRNQEFANCVK